MKKHIFGASFTDDEGGSKKRETISAVPEIVNMQIQWIKFFSIRMLLKINNKKSN